MKVGVIASGNGGAFKAFQKCVKLPTSNIIVVTDRECGIEHFALDNGIVCERISAKDNDHFSLMACKKFEEQNVDVVFLFFTRLVTECLFSKIPTINFHPSLLPSFRGFNPIKRALEQRVKFFGTTMHVVDSGIDSGQILAQAVYPLVESDTVEYLERVSFVHKVHHMLLIFESFKYKLFTFSDGKVGGVLDGEFGKGYSPIVQDNFYMEYLEKLEVLNKIEKRYY